MKRTIISFLFAVVFSISLFAQPVQNDQRTIETKIADLLMKLPPQSSADQNRVMTELSALGGKALAVIAENLVAPGKGDDVAFRYAISGLVKYVAKGGNTDQMKSCSLAICKAIGDAKDDEVKDFLLQELQYIAGDEAVTVVCNYLSNNRLCDPAARVLVRINSELSKKAISEVLSRTDVVQQITLIEALGEMRHSSSVEKIRMLTTTSDLNLKKTVLRALAEMGDIQSASLLATEAEKSKYSFESTDAVGSYLLFLKRVAENGNSAFVENACMNILKNKEVPVYTQSAALQLLTEHAGEKAIPELMNALKSADKDYRIAAQSLLETLFSPDVSKQMQKIVKSTNNNELKAELIRMLAIQNDKSAFPLLLKMLKSDNRQVKLATIKAVAKTGQAEAIAPITNLVKSGNDEIIIAAKAALLSIDNDGVADAAAVCIPQVSGTARCAMIEIIAKRQAARHGNLIICEAENSDSQVKLAAAKALPFVVKSGDEEKIAGLLNKASDEKEISALQDALFAAIQNLGKQSEQISSVMSMMKKAGDKQALYYNVLAKIGGIEALAIVEKEFETSSSVQKEAALKALSNWSDFTALDALCRISRNNPSGKFHDVALGSYIAGINKSGNTADQKVLMFRNAMELAASVNQQKQILQGISKNSTLPALIFASKYLDHSDLQQTAVQSVIAIILANSSLYGAMVEEIVRKAISLNKDDEANYQKQALLKHLASLPQTDGFVPMFNGKDLTGWKGLVGNPVSRASMSEKALAEAQVVANKEAIDNWTVENDMLVFSGKGNNLCSVKNYADFEMYVDWKLYPGDEPDAGIYLRGTPQVQIWDTSRVNVGAQVGSGGLYNNKKNLSKPLVVADNAVGEWNSFYIKMVADRVTVYLNGRLGVDNIVMENYWDRNQPIFPFGQIELQAHGSKVAYRDIYIREIKRPQSYQVSEQENKEGFVPLFNGLNMDGWVGNTTDYFAQEGMIVYKPAGENSMNVNTYTAKEYSDFILRFEFKLTPGANNGLGIRTPIHGNAAYVGMELQILDNEAGIYKDRLQPYQYHGSVYGVIPAKRGFLKPVGEWNYQEVQAIGNRIKVTLNGEVILDGDIAEASKNGTETADHLQHPGLLNKSGHIGFLGHGKPLSFRNLRIKSLE